MKAQILALTLALTTSFSAFGLTVSRDASTLQGAKMTAMTDITLSITDDEAPRVASYVEQGFSCRIRAYYPQNVRSLTIQKGDVLQIQSVDHSIQNLYSDSMSTYGSYNFELKIVGDKSQTQFQIRCVGDLQTSAFGYSFPKRSMSTDYFADILNAANVFRAQP